MTHIRKFNESIYSDFSDGAIQDIKDYLLKVEYMDCVGSINCVCNRRDYSIKENRDVFDVCVNISTKLLDAPSHYYDDQVGIFYINNVTDFSTAESMFNHSNRMVSISKELIVFDRRIKNHFNVDNMVYTIGRRGVRVKFEIRKKLD